jgi:exodeoxyribonuclease III
VSAVETDCLVEDPEEAVDNDDNDADKGSNDLNQEGRLIIVHFGSEVSLINCYVPNAGDSPERPRLSFKLRYLRALRYKLRQLGAAGRRVLLVGDLNLAVRDVDVHPSLGGAARYSDEERAIFQSIRVDLGYIDAWAEYNERVKPVERYTCWDERTSARSFGIGLRIDYILVSADFDSQIRNCETLGVEAIPPKWSDHAALTLSVLGVPRATAVANNKPCKEWTALLNRFHSGQRSILELFKKKRPPEDDLTVDDVTEDDEGTEDDEVQLRGKGEIAVAEAAEAGGQEEGGTEVAKKKPRIDGATNGKTADGQQQGT